MQQIKKMTIVTIPKDLKGVLNNNDDPLRCAVCLKSFGGTLADVTMNFCCGRMACGECNAAGTIYNRLAKICLLCPKTNNKAKIGTLKKHAKRGVAWAQFLLALVFIDEDQKATQHDTLRWLRKASAKGNPMALSTLSRMYLSGRGCNRDLGQAQKYGEALYSSGVSIIRNSGRSVLRELGSEFVSRATLVLSEAAAGEKGLQILRRLASADDVTVECKYELAMAYYNFNDFSSSLPWLVAVALDESCGENLGRTAGCAMLCCDRLDLLPQTKLWMNLAEKNCFDFTQDKSTKLEVSYLSLKLRLRILRRSCAHCGVGLTRDTRKLCKGCRTCCYCSVDCQKHHWAEGSHRGECKEVTRLKKMLKKG